MISPKKLINLIAKSNRLGNQLAGPRKGRESRFHPYDTQTARSNMFHKRQNSRTYQSFFGGISSATRSQIGCDPVKEVNTIGTLNQVSVPENIANLLSAQQGFVGGQTKCYLDNWHKLTSDPFVLMCVSNCQIEFNKIPTSGTRKTMPVYQFSQAEQTVIDNEIEQFLGKP